MSNRLINTSQSPGSKDLSYVPTVGNGGFSIDSMQLIENNTFFRNGYKQSSRPDPRESLQKDLYQNRALNNGMNFKNLIINSEHTSVGLSTPEARSI